MGLPRTRIWRPASLAPCVVITLIVAFFVAYAATFVIACTITRVIAYAAALKVGTFDPMTGILSRVHRRHHDCDNRKHSYEDVVHTMHKVGRPSGQAFLPHLLHTRRHITHHGGFGFRGLHMPTPVADCGLVLRECELLWQLVFELAVRYGRGLATSVCHWKTMTPCDFVRRWSWQQSIPLALPPILILYTMRNALYTPI